LHYMNQCVYLPKVGVGQTAFGCVSYLLNRQFPFVMFL